MESMCPIACGDHAALQAMCDSAAEKGANAALARIGLTDEAAAKDVRDLRDLIAGWRDVRQVVIRTVVKWITLGVLGALAAGAWLQWGQKP
jgi:hypothetical protein